jgi:hypothetical protein
VAEQLLYLTGIFLILDNHITLQTSVQQLFVLNNQWARECFNNQFVVLRIKNLKGNLWQITLSAI